MHKKTAASCLVQLSLGVLPGQVVMVGAGGNPPGRRRMPRVVTHLGLRRRRQLDGDLPNCWLEVMLFLFLTTFFHRQPIGTVLSRIGKQVPHAVVGQTRHIWMLFRTKFAGGQKNITFFARFALVTPGSLLLLRKSCQCSFFFCFLVGAFLQTSLA